MDHMAEGGAHASSHRAGSMRMYLVVGGLSVVITIIAFLLVWASIPLRPYLLPIILMMAAFQVALQTVLFMHLNLGRRLYSLFFGFGMSLALIVAGGVFIITASLSPGPPAALSTLSSSTPPTTTTGKGSTSSSSSSSGATSQAAAMQIITSRCEACHTVNGSGGKIGPDLNEVMAGKVLPGMVPGGHPTEETWLVSWITDPQKVWPQAQMPDLGLTSSQVEAVAAYLQKLK
jgi:heme/copper-type cytochrome/quinol oxidase subunit 4/cytochrome c2